MSQAAFYPAQPGATRRIGAAQAIVGDLDPKPTRCVLSPDVHATRIGVLGDVGERLGDRKVCRRLHRRRNASWQVDIGHGGHRAVQRERPDSIAEAAFGEHRGVDPAYQGAQLGQGPRGVLPSLGDQRHGRVRVGPDQPLGRAQRDAHRH